MHPRLLIAAASLVLTVVTPAAQRSSHQPESIFRSEINFVQLPVRVVDNRGDFVRGLQDRDFQVLEDGAPQTIAAFTFVDIPIIAAVEAPVASLEPLAASHEVGAVDGRVFLLVLDDYQLEPGETASVRSLLQRLIREHISANDLVALTFTSGARGQDFTRNRQLLFEAVSRFIGVLDTDPNTSRREVDDRAHGVLMTLANSARQLAAIGGRHKALIFVSRGVECLPEARWCNETFDDIARAATRSDVSIYGLDPRGLVLADGSEAENRGAGSDLPNAWLSHRAFIESHRNAHSGLRRLADQTGGFAAVDTNNFKAVFERIVRENSSYYLVGYYSTNDRTDGQFRKHQIKVNRRGMKVLHRAGYIASRGVR